MSKLNWPVGGMTQERYQELENNSELNLTDEEYKKGWHFCISWDFMLIHKSWDENSRCKCIIQD